MGRGPPHFGQINMLDSISSDNTKLADFLPARHHRVFSVQNCQSTADGSDQPIIHPGILPTLGI